MIFSDNESEQLQLNIPMRAAFIEYIKDECWQDNLREFERHDCFSCQNQNVSIWARYGYKSTCDLEASTFRKASLPKTIKRTSSESSLGSTMVSSISFHDNFQDYSSDDFNELFDGKADMKALVVYVLFPLFREHMRLQKLGIRTESRDIFEDSDPTAASITKSHRLQEIMTRASASADFIQLDAYFANPSSHYLMNLQEAFMHLPLRIMIARIINLPNQEPTSPVIYTNAALSRADGKVLGTDLHIIYGNTCSPGGAVQLKRAIFSGRTFKKKYNLSFAACKLLAILPLCNSEGDVVYSVSVESDAFADPSVPAGDLFHSSKQESAIEHLQMIEDMLALLPLLVRV